MAHRVALRHTTKQTRTCLTPSPHLKEVIGVATEAVALEEPRFKAAVVIADPASRAPNGAPAAKVAKQVATTILRT